MRARRPFAALAGRSAGRLSRLIGRGGGSAVGGLVASVIDPRFVRDSFRGLASTVVVTGTNGKTTTTSLISGLSRDAGRRVMTNPTGSNLERGVAAAVLPYMDWVANLRDPAGLHAVLELDERAFLDFGPALDPSVVVLLNLFRDQLDRYGEVNATATALATSMDQIKGATLVVNADDPALVSVARRYQGPVAFFGMDGWCGADAPDVWADVRRCPECEARLEWSWVVFAHLGDYRCEECGFCRPLPDVRVKDYESRGLDGATYLLEIAEVGHPVSTGLPGVYNAYNVAAAAAATRALALDTDAISSVLRAAEPVFGRAERIDAGPTTIVVLLVKNPSGANQAIDLLRSEASSFDVLVLLNDGVADGEDVSWIWDVEFDRLAAHRITVGGVRAEDLALRLKYAHGRQVAGKIHVQNSIEAALNVALNTAPRYLVILPTYTAMLELRLICARRGWVKPFWRVAV
jgi:UDP-N-acetylmuramyl tripeptide synthase